MREDSWQALTLAEQEGRLGRFTTPVERPTREHYIPDIHYPYHNEDAVSHILGLVYGADLICFIGDDIDADSIMRHTRAPHRKSTLFEQCQGFSSTILAKVRQQNPQARIIKILGNHEEDRLQRYIWNNCPELADIPYLSWSTLLEADKYRVEVVSRKGLLIHGKRAKHGDVATKGAGNSARREMEEHRCDGVSGHTHRYAVVQRTDKEGHTTRWAEIGHAMDVAKAEYIKATPDWCLSGGLTVEYETCGAERWTEHRLQ